MCASISCTTGVADQAMGAGGCHSSVVEPYCSTWSRAQEPFRKGVWAQDYVEQWWLSQVVMFRFLLYIFVS